jgi:hypothetical protein
VREVVGALCVSSIAAARSRWIAEKSKSLTKSACLNGYEFQGWQKMGLPSFKEQYQLRHTW